MKFYTFGNEENQVILLLPGTCCHWKRNFEHVIPLLEQNFYVVCVSYDGFDETEQTVFPDMITETEKIETYIHNNFGGHICAAYGCSMGGSFVGLLIQRGNIHIDHGILGSSDLDQGSGISARFQAWLISQVLYSMFQKGKLPGWMQKRLEKKTPEERAYLDRMLKMFGVGESDMIFVQKESIRSQFYSDLVTPLENGIGAPGTRIHCFYAEKMGEQYLARYQQHFQSPDIRYHDMQHEELLVCHPLEWVKEVEDCCRFILKSHERKAGSKADTCEEKRTEKQRMEKQRMAEKRTEKQKEEKYQERKHEEIKNAYKYLGGEATFYDGMITCSTLSGKAVCKIVWNMNKKKNDHYLKLALDGISRDFSGKLLEVPVGTGVLTMPIYQTLPNADITCLDYSFDMMARAKRQAEKRNLANIHFMQGDVGKLPFADESFDLVLSLNGFHAFPDKEAAYEEIFRVLKPGGIFCGCFYVKGENRRTDWFIEKIYTPKGFFTPPYETAYSLQKRLAGMYRKSQVKTVEAMACFRCRK